MSINKKQFSGAEASKQEYVYNEIRRRIIDNVYKPGTRLVERSIGEELNVSRTPVREAFKRLEQDGFVQISGRGALVSEISIDNMLEIFEMREALEKMAIKLFLLKANNEMFERLENCAREQQAAYDKGDADLYMKKDMEFHNLIAEGSKNGRLINGIRGIYDQVSMLAISAENDAALLTMAVKQHNEIMAAIKSRDIQRAENAITNHIVDTKKYHISKQLGLSDGLFT